jgi:hypothetical protein
MIATKEQFRVLYAFVKDGLFTCPGCGTQTVTVPLIQNKGEEQTQVWCHYGCGFLFLDAYELFMPKGKEIRNE